MRAIAVFVVTVVLTTMTVSGQRWRAQPELATSDSYDGEFHYCRVAFGSNRNGAGGGWLTDYPDADLNLSIRLGELTKTRVSRDSSGDPIRWSFGSPMRRCFNVRSS